MGKCICWPNTIKFRIGLEIALFSKLVHFNTIMLTKISLQCAILLCYGNMLTKSYYIHPICRDCKILRLHLCREVLPQTRKEVTCNAEGRHFSGWTVTIVVTWLTTPYFGLYWAKRAIAEARSDQSAGHYSPSAYWSSRPYPWVTL